MDKQDEIFESIKGIAILMRGRHFTQQQAKLLHENIDMRTEKTNVERVLDTLVALNCSKNELLEIIIQLLQFGKDRV